MREMVVVKMKMIHCLALRGLFWKCTHCYVPYGVMFVSVTVPVAAQ